VRRGAIVRVVTIALLAAAVATAVALFIPWLPPLRSEEGERIDFVLWFTVAICIGLFAIVAAISLYSVAKFRVRPDDEHPGPTAECPFDDRLLARVLKSADMERRRAA